MNQLKTYALIWWMVGLAVAFITFPVRTPNNIEVWMVGFIYIGGFIHYILGIFIDELDRIINPPVVNKIEITQEGVDKTV